MDTLEQIKHSSLRPRDIKDYHSAKRENSGTRFTQEDLNPISQRQNFQFLAPKQDIGSKHHHDIARYSNYLQNEVIEVRHNMLTRPNQSEVKLGNGFDQNHQFDDIDDVLSLQPEKLDVESLNYD